MQTQLQLKDLDTTPIKETLIWYDAPQLVRISTAEGLTAIGVLLYEEPLSALSKATSTPKGRIISPTGDATVWLYSIPTQTQLIALYTGNLLYADLFLNAHALYLHEKWTSPTIPFEQFLQIEPTKPFPTIIADFDAQEALVPMTFTISEPRSLHEVLEMVQQHASQNPK